MGTGIATALLTARLPVTLVETDANRAEAARSVIAKNLAGSVKRGKMDATARDAALSTLTTAQDIGMLADADLVIEAIFEDREAKRDLFARLDRVCKPGAILATNTSYLNVNAMADATGRPEDVIGLHYFSPAHVMRLLEVVVADRTAPEVVATGFALAKRQKKVAVRAGVCDGFIGNRILAHYRKVADYLALDGAPFEQVDSALRDFGFAMGPFEVADLAGLDVAWANRKRLAASRPAAERYSRVADRLCEVGHFGRKTGQGYYLHDGGAPVPNPTASEIFDAERYNAVIVPRPFSDAEIVDRITTAMIAEATRVLEEGIALRPIDIDAVMLFGYGFPRHCGGPMFYADQLGATEVIARIKRYASEDPWFWKIPPLLQRLADSQGLFAELNKE